MVSWPSKHQGRRESQPGDMFYYASSKLSIKTCSVIVASVSILNKEGNLPLTFLTVVMEGLPKRTGTVFLIHRGQVSSAVLTDVRFCKKRSPICVKKYKKLDVIK